MAECKPSLDDENHTSLPSFEDRLKELAPVIEALKARLVAELGRSDFPDAKVLWKVMALYQALIRRTLELVSGTADAWSGSRIALTLGRSLVETLAVVWDLTKSIQEGIEQQDLSAVDKLVMDHVFATRISSWMQEGLPTATNTLTLISRLDQALAEGAGENGDDADRVRSYYDLLSDFAHPNFLGVTSLAGVLDKDRNLWRFEVDEETRVRIGQTLMGALVSVEMIEHCIRAMDRMVEPLRKLNVEARQRPI